MVSVEEAERIILSQKFILSKQTIAIQEASRKVLGEEVVADRDLPPFNRATMDGIAICFESYENGIRQFLIEGVQAAGHPKQSLKNKKNCYEIMTGAALPDGTDTVIPYEVIVIENNEAVIKEVQVSKNQNVHFQGNDAKQNEILLHKGMKLSPSEIAVLASVGKNQISIYHIKAAVISTGDELVEVDQMPLPHQIRKSNSHALVAALHECGVDADVFHLRDNETELNQSLQRILTTYELIILSGGVSKGKLDFVPQVLESLGVKKLVHGISQRPGKPMWFGASLKNFVFALPGNPVSTFMCFHRYVKPWLQKIRNEDLKEEKGILAEDFSFAPALTYFLQVKVKNEDGKLMCYPQAGGGSGDFVNLKDVDGFLELPLEPKEFKAGSVYRLYSFR